MNFPAPPFSMIGFRDWQSVAFFTGIGVYALFSSPTPDTLGWAECVTGILLVLAVRVQDVRAHAFSFCALVAGLVVPSVTALIHGADSADMVRDIIPFLFLFMPLFYGWVPAQWGQKYLGVVAMAGGIFAVRTLWVYSDVVLRPVLWGQGPPADLLYLANSPEVLCAALYCAARGGHSLCLENRFLKGGALLFLSLLPLTAMALMMQRAGLGIFALNCAAWVMALTYTHARRGGAVVLALIGIAACVWPFLETLGGILWQKTELVGLNSRGQEWQAVLGVVGSDTPSMLFGEGWGGRLENPAVGGLSVNYTHSLLSSLLLKTGVVGMGGILVGMLAPFLRTFRVRRADFMLFGAVLSPFLISAGLYASYKSLGFGLILLAFLSFLPRKLEKNPESVS